MDNNLKELDTQIESAKKKLKKLKEQRANYVKTHTSKLPSDYLRISDGNEEYVFFIKKVDYTTDGRVFSLTGSGISISGNACFKKESAIYQHELKKYDAKYITQDEYNKLFEKGIELIRTQNYSKQIMEKKIYTVIAISEPQGAKVDAFTVSSFNSLERAEECRKEFFKKEVETFQEIYGKGNVVFDENTYEIETTNYDDKLKLLIDDNFLIED